MEAFHTLYSTGIWTVLFLYTAYRFARCIRMVPQRKAYIIERLGKYHQTLGPGFHVLIPYLDRIAYVQDLREEAIEVPPQEAFTKDNVRIEVDGIVYISVIDPVNASYGITDYRFAAIQLAQTTTRSVVGTMELDRTFEERDEVNARVVGVLSEVAEAWGIRVHRYEVKNIVPPETVRNAMERQMGAERDKRAVLASAEGEMRSRINESEGRMHETINRSEGEKQRRINEAEGRAQEILAVAQATAESIEKVGAALARPGGVDATNLRLNQQLVDQLGKLANGDASVLLPSDLTAVDKLTSAISLTNGKTAVPAIASLDDGRTKPSNPAS